MSHELLSEDVHELCRRVLVDDLLAGEAADTALGSDEADRTELLRLASHECRSRGEAEPGALAPGLDGPGAGSEVASGSGSDAAPATPHGSLAEAVAAELARANASLPERQREALALRELLRLSYAQIGTVMDLDAAAVAALLSRARLMLRSRLRGSTAELEGRCEDRDHALRLLARRQDSEPLGPADDTWIRDHLATCRDCERAHAAMLEASVCYRAWGRA